MCYTIIIQRRMFVFVTSAWHWKKSCTKKTPKQKKYNKWNPGSLDFDIKGSTTEQKKLSEELGYILSWLILAVGWTFDTYEPK